MRAQELKAFELLADFDARDREALAAALVERRLPAGACLFREGDEASGLYLVVGGNFELTSRRAGRLGALGPGAWLGAASLVTLGRREATARAQETARVWQLDRPALRRLVEDAPRTGCRLLEAIAGDLASALRPALERMAVDPAASSP